MKRSFIFAGVVCAAGVALAQAEPGMAIEEEVAEPVVSLNEAETPQVISEEDLFGPSEKTEKVEFLQVVNPGVDAAEQCQAFIAKKGWDSGMNLKPNGSPFIVCTGVGTVLQKPTKNNAVKYTQDRTGAFDRAMFAAKQQLAEFLGTTIETAIQMSLIEPDTTESPTTVLARQIANAPANSTFGRFYRQAYEEAQKALAKQDLDMAAARAAGGEELAEAQAQALEIVGSTTFKSSIKRSANACISGLQAFQTFEAINKDGTATIGVVAVWSPKLAYFAEALTSADAPVTLSKAKKPIREQIPTDKNALLSSFGVTCAINERGEQVLISYGQWVARGKSLQSGRIAAQRAAAQAQAQIRDFAGEAFAFHDTSENAAAYLEAEGMDDILADQDSYEAFYEGKAEALTIRGFNPPREWTAIHPFTGAKVYGAIVTWSPSSANLAVKAKAYSDAKAAPAAAGKSDYNEAPAANANVFGDRKTASQVKAEQKAKYAPKEEKVERREDFYEAGASGDDDAF